MVKEMERTYRRTNIYLLDDELWAWAQYRAKQLQYRSVSEYVFYLIKLDKEGRIKEILAKLEEGNQE